MIKFSLSATGILVRSINHWLNFSNIYLLDTKYHITRLFCGLVDSKPFYRIQSLSAVSTLPCFTPQEFEESLIFLFPTKL